MTLIQYNHSRRRQSRIRRPSCYRKREEETVDEDENDEKTILRNSNSGIDGRVLVGAQQTGRVGDPQTEGSRGNHRKRGALQVLHLRPWLGAGRSTVSCGITRYGGLQGGRVARRIRLTVAALDQILYLGKR